MARGLGWRPELPDVRDHRFALVAPRLAAALPARVDLRDRCGPMRDQGTLGSCTGFAITNAVHFIHAGTDHFKDHTLSPLFVYYEERKMEGTIKEDAGAFLRDGIKAVRATGVPHEQRWPYRVSRYRWRPREAAYRDAARNLIGSYQRLDTLSDMQTCLAAGFPFVFGFAVYPEFLSDEVERTGVVPMPSGLDAPLGGHAVMACGFDSDTQRFTVQNSWGDEWGQGGFFTIPYAYLTSRYLSDDFWTVRP